MKKASILIIVSLLFLTITSTVSAQLNGVVDPTGGNFSLGDLIARGLVIVFALVGFLAVVVFSIGALRYLTSRGDTKAADSARGTMTGAVIGLVIVLGAASVSGVFKSVFGIDLFGGNNQTAPIFNNTVRLDCAFRIFNIGGAGEECLGFDPRYNTLGGIVTQVLLALLAIGAIAFFFMLLWGGFRYMTARGDEKAVTDARSTLTNAAVGLLLMIAALVIIRLIAQTLFKAGGILS